TLFFIGVLFSAAGFAQEHRYYNNNKYNDTYQYPSSGNGYDYTDPYNNSWNDGDYGDRFRHSHRFNRWRWYHKRHWGYRDADDMIPRNQGYYDNYNRGEYWHKKRLSLQIFIHGRNRF